MGRPLQVLFLSLQRRGVEGFYGVKEAVMLQAGLSLCQRGCVLYFDILWLFINDSEDCEMLFGWLGQDQPRVWACGLRLEAGSADVGLKATSTWSVGACVRSGVLGL